MVMKMEELRKALAVYEYCLSLKPEIEHLFYPMGFNLEELMREGREMRRRVEELISRGMEDL